MLLKTFAVLWENYKPKTRYLAFFFFNMPKWTVMSFTITYILALLCFISVRMIISFVPTMSK